MTDYEFIIESILEQINKRERLSISCSNAKLLRTDDKFGIHTIEFKDGEKVRRFKAIGVNHGWNLTELK